MNALDHRIASTLNALELTGGSMIIRMLLREIQSERNAEPHPLKPRGDAERHRLVAARLGLREGMYA